MSRRRRLTHVDEAMGAQRFPVATTESVDSRTVTGYLGLAMGLTVSPYESSPGHAAEAERAEDRHEAVRRLIESAKALGADAVVGLRFDTVRSGTDTVEVLAYGTAVSLAPF
jgi:uncharacterized protein YbjQ (UPF0145 family)